MTGVGQDLTDPLTPHKYMTTSAYLNQSQDRFNQLSPSVSQRPYTNAMLNNQYYHDASYTYTDDPNWQAMSI